MANVFVLAKAYQKKHPRTAWQDCIKAVSKGAKKVSKTEKKTVKPTVKKAVGKKPIAAKKVTVKVRKSGAVKMSIGSISLGKIGAEQSLINRIENEITNIRSKMKIKGIAVSEKSALAKHLAKNNAALKVSKQHITQLKKLL